jgi:hypothetical protein
VNAVIVKIIFPNVLVWKIRFAAQLTWEKTPSRGAHVGSREWWRYFKRCKFTGSQEGNREAILR